MISKTFAQTRTSPLLAGLFASPVAACELRGEGDPHTLLPEEAGTCGALRPQRLAEFAAGRQCARQALSALGFERVAVRRNVDRTPRWPGGSLGSITHTVGFAGAVVAPAGPFAALGVDAELVVRVTRDLWSHAFTADELAVFAAFPHGPAEYSAAIAFSAKEALYKCQYAVTGRWLDYRDVSVTIEGDGTGGEFRIRPVTANGCAGLGDLEPHGRYRIENDLVVTGVAFTAAQAELLGVRQLSA